MECLSTRAIIALDKKAIELNLNSTYDIVTPGDDSRWFHAIIANFARQDIKIAISKPGFMDSSLKITECLDERSLTIFWILTQVAIALTFEVQVNFDVFHTSNMPWRNSKVLFYYIKLG